MAVVDIRVPQMGEGLTEVRLIEFMKSPGDTVSRDEVIYTMETDKATLEVESPEAGVLTEWLAAEGDVLPIGATIARIDQEGVATSAAAAPASTAAAPVSRRPSAPERVVPPRTRAYARELGLTDEQIAQIPSVTAKLMPADIDAYRAADRAVPGPEAEAEETLTYQDRPLPDRQRKLNFHLKRSAQIVVPGTIRRPIVWDRPRELVAAWRAKDAAHRLTEFQTFAYCAVRAAGSCPKFRCALIREDTVRQYDRLQLGVAVALPDGELTTAVVQDADLLPFAEFARTLHERIQSARAGNDQADASVQMLLSYLGQNGVRDANPVLVAPAAAVIFLGASYTDNGRLYSNVSLTFDHRLLNGVEAADMLTTIANEIENLNVSEPG